MFFLALIFPFLTQAFDAPKKICLPIRVAGDSPIEFALNSLREGIAYQSDLIEISCSQPDYQLFYSIDKSLKNKDDFILIISDVNIEISAGSERGVMYGILEFLRQLKSINFEISDVRSVVSHPNTAIRGLKVGYQFFSDRILRKDWILFLNEMVALRYNHLIIGREFAGGDIDQSVVESSIENLKQLSKSRGIEFEMEGLLSDKLQKKGLSYNRNGMSDMASSEIASSVFVVRNFGQDFLRLSKLKAYPMISIQVDHGAIHNFSNWYQYQWGHIFSRQDRSPAMVILDCSDPGLYQSDSSDFLKRFYNYFENWSQQFEDPIDNLSQGPIKQDGACYPDLLKLKIAAAERASTLLSLYFSDMNNWFDWRTNQKKDRLRQGSYYSFEEMLSDFQRDEFYTTEGSLFDGKISLPSLIDSLKYLQSEIGEIPIQNCQQPKLDFLLTDLAEFRTCLSYYLHKFEGVNCLLDFSKSKKRLYKLQAIDHLNSALGIWKERWSDNQASDIPVPNTPDQWIEKATDDTEFVRKFRN